MTSYSPGLWNWRLVTGFNLVSYPGYTFWRCLTPLQRILLGYSKSHLFSLRKIQSILQRKLPRYLFFCLISSTGFDFKKIPCSFEALFNFFFVYLHLFDDIHISDVCIFLFLQVFWCFLDLCCSIPSGVSLISFFIFSHCTFFSLCYKYWCE